jgi:hypothetical protein
VSEWSGRVRRITYYRSPYDLYKYRGDKENRYLKGGEKQYAVTVETGNGERIWFQSRSNFHKDKLSYWNKKEIRGSDMQQAHNAKYGGKSYHFFPLLNVGDQITVTGDARSEKGGVKFLKTGAKFKLSDGGSVGVIDTSRGTIIKSELDYLVKKFGIKKIAVNLDFARDGLWQFLSGFQDAFTSKFAASVIKHRMNKLNDRELDKELRARALLDAIIKKRRIHFDAKEHKSLVEKLKKYLKSGVIAESLRTPLYLLEIEEPGIDWWEEPRNLREKLVLRIFNSKPKGTLKGSEVVWKDGMRSKDPTRPWYRKKDWKKMKWTHVSRAGCKTVIHYWLDPDGSRVYPKFKLVKQAEFGCK